MIKPCMGPCQRVSSNNTISKGRPYKKAVFAVQARSTPAGRLLGSARVWAAVNTALVLEGDMADERFPRVGAAPVRSYGIMALGLAACKPLREEGTSNLTTVALHHQVTQLSFEGGDGRVEFLKSASRDPESINYRLVNFVRETVYAEENNRTRILLEERERVVLSQHGGVIESIAPMVWSDNTTQQPLPLLPLEENQNLVSSGMQAFCWVIAAAVLLASLLCAIWTLARRGRPKQSPSFSAKPVGTIYTWGLPHRRCNHTLDIPGTNSSRATQYWLRAEHVAIFDRFQYYLCKTPCTDIPCSINILPSNNIDNRGLKHFNGQPFLPQMSYGYLWHLLVKM